jgi:hypothetical protein
VRASVSLTRQVEHKLATLKLIAGPDASGVVVMKTVDKLLIVQSTVVHQRRACQADISLPGWAHNNEKGLQQQAH